VKKEDRSAVAAFLVDLKSVLKSGGDFFLIPRRENLQSLADLGLTFKNCRDILLDLSVDNYHDGPLEDRDRPGMVWIFGKDIGGCEIYIKLKLIGAESAEKVVCISFHRANFTMRFPCGDKDKGNPE
jgi:hypothetical protein